MTIWDILFFFMMLTIGLIWLSLFLVLAMQFLMPKNVLQTYFKKPFFRDFEVAIFTGAPYSPIRTVMFMGVFAFPSLGKKRKLTEAYLLVPGWYRNASKILVIAILFEFISIIIVMLIAGILIFFE